MVAVVPPTGRRTRARWWSTPPPGRTSNSGRSPIKSPAWPASRCTAGYSYPLTPPPTPPWCSSIRTSGRSSTRTHLTRRARARPSRFTPAAARSRSWSTATMTSSSRPRIRRGWGRPRASRSCCHRRAARAVREPPRSAQPSATMQPPPTATPGRAKSSSRFARSTPTQSFLRAAGGTGVTT